jgi:xanthine dehydrogenase accessory factor
MKEIKTILEAYDQIDFGKNKAALVTVVRVEGSSYRRAGARMLVTEDGQWIGGISGGCLEGDALRKARLAMAQNKPTLITYDTTGDDPFQIGVGLGCNGIIDVLIKPLEPENANNPVRSLKNIPSQRLSNLMVTVTYLSDETDFFRLGDVFRFDNAAHFQQTFTANTLTERVIEDIETTFERGKSTSHRYQLPDGTTVGLFLELLPPPIHLAVYGSSYDVYPLVKIAKEVGWKVSVVCNPAKMHFRLAETADAVINKNEGDATLDPYTAVVLMAHDYESDFGKMQQFLKTDLSYIGLLGPRKRTDKMLDTMRLEGRAVSEANQERLHSPIGLDMGATTPEEIAISIIAEVRAHFAGREGGPLRKRDRPIYEE